MGRVENGDGYNRGVGRKARPGERGRGRGGTGNYSHGGVVVTITRTLFREGSAQQARGRSRVGPRDFYHAPASGGRKIVVAPGPRGTAFPNEKAYRPARTGTATCRSPAIQTLWSVFAQHGGERVSWATLPIL